MYVMYVVYAMYAMYVMYVMYVCMYVRTYVCMYNVRNPILNLRFFLDSLYPPFMIEEALPSGFPHFPHCIAREC